jgi:hypothetical protein
MMAAFKREDYDAALHLAGKIGIEYAPIDDLAASMLSYLIYSVASTAFFAGAQDQIARTANGR